MKNIVSQAALGLLLSSALLSTSCDKDDTGELSGPVTPGTFTTTSRTVGLTTEVTFTAAPNDDAFLYQWEFGDGNGPDGTGSVGSGKTVTHVYTRGGTFRAQLITASRGGTGFSEKKDVVIPSSLSLVNQLLTGGSSRTWKLDNAADAPIVVGTEAAPTTYFAGVAPGGLPACQSDDEYTFSTSNTFTYDAKAETFYADRTNYTCQAPLSGTSPFVFAAATGTGLAQFTLSRAGAFIGATDASLTERVYRILSIDNQKMVLRAGSGQNGGTVFTIKLAVK